MMCYDTFTAFYKYGYDYATPGYVFNAYHASMYSIYIHTVDTFVIFLR